MRYVEITHTYVLPVPAEDTASIDAIANAGVSMMEEFMKGRASQIRQVRSDWKLMPKEYDAEAQELITYEKGQVPQKFTDTPHERDRLESLRVIEADMDEGISFTGDVMGQRPAPPAHPWDQGSRITPPGHDLFNAETQALREEGKLCGYGVNDDECVLVAGHPGDHLLMPVPDETREITDGER